MQFPLPLLGGPDILVTLFPQLSDALIFNMEGKILMLSEKILGVWEMQSWEAVVDDRGVGYPLGEKASGFIAYDPAGLMSVNISAPNRARIPVDDPFEGDPTFLI